MDRATLYVGSFLACLSVAAGTPAAAQAQDDPPPDDESGWERSLSLGANLNVTSNQNVVGQTDGESALAGLNSAGYATYTNKPHELRMTGSLVESFARTPTVDEFVKNTDLLSLEGIYNYFFLPWSGAFGRLGVDTSLFENYHVAGEPTTYAITDRDGTERTLSQVDRFQTANPFRPTSLSESVGAFAEQTDIEEFQFRSRLGLGARQTFARGVYVVADDEETPEIEVEELSHVFQGGVEGFLGVSGTFTEQRLSYDAGLTGLLPVLNNDAADRPSTELFRLAFTAGLTFNAFEWLSANYNVDITRDPQLIDETQIQNNVLLTLKYDLIANPDDEGPTTEEQLDEARNRIETLEGRIQEMEGDDRDEDQEDEQEDGEEQE